MDCFYRRNKGDTAILKHKDNFKFPIFNFKLRDEKSMEHLNNKTKKQQSNKAKGQENIGTMEQ